MVNRLTTRDLAKLPSESTAQQAAIALNVSKQTILNACKRLGIGRRLPVGSRGIVLLSREDLAILSRQLQDGPGRLPMCQR